MANQSGGIGKKVDRFFQGYRLQKFDKGHILIQAGAEPPGVFYLESGNVREYDISDQGNEVVINVFKPEAFFPMSWAINKTPNDYFFEAAEQVAVRQAPADEVVEFLKSNPDVTFDLLSRVYRGTDGLLRRMAHLMGGSARTRVLFELLIEGRRFGQVRPGGGLLVQLREDELAKRAGLSRETVNRQLAKLIQEKLLRVTPEGLILKDMTVIEKSLGDKL